MSGPQSLVTVTVSAEQQAVLEALQRQASCPQALALRVRIVLGAASGQRVGPLATRLGCSRFTVRTWRNRWVAAQSQLAAAEAVPSALRQIVEAVGHPVDAWTPRELADQAKRQGIVSSISPTTVGRFLGRGRASAAS